MPKPSWIIEPDCWDTAPIIADLAAIRQYNPQRFEMEQLTAIVYEDPAHHICVGYKDLTANEFWVRGFVSQSPIMPPALICEAAAQLANYYARKHTIYAGQGGFVGLDAVRCRGAVYPGERLFVLARLVDRRSRLLTCQFQCAVDKRVICDGILIGGVFKWMATQRRDTPRASIAGSDGD